MKKHLMNGLLALLALGALSNSAWALRDLSLKQQGELPRDQFVDLVNPDHFSLDKLVLQFVEDTRIRLRGDQFVSLEGRDLSPVESFLKAHPEIKVERLFSSLSENDLDEYVAKGELRSGYDVADLNNFYLLRVEGHNASPRQLLEELLKFDLVQTCYYEAIPSPAVCGVDPAPATPNYVASQDYREAAPTGIDINYAWAHDPTYGNGIGSYWFQDLEWGWCETHEDYASLNIVNGPDSTTPDFFNHGTAVMGIVGACADAKGVSGLVPEVNLTARVVSNHPSTADALINIGFQLLTGETYLIEMHAGGPNPGWSCVCNCGQFTYIAMEYWTAEFNAILANSTNGKYCIEAAGNGSMDLDWAGYGGAFNLGVRDSQAIMIGAGTSGSVHNPECWTNHGTRISAQGWGDSVYSTGYGDAFNPAGCDQDYTTSFSGTSSASPIVTGAAISLALIHRYQEGSYLSPTGLRSRLTINGTPQGPTDTWKEINVLPNMKGILAPDLAPYTPGGWTSSIVPSNTTGTTTLPANLYPAPATTYFDYAWVNWSFYSTVTNSHVRVYQDDEWFVGSTVGLHPRYFFQYTADWGRNMRGGLHYIKLVADPLGTVDESIESNNTYITGLRWDPIILSDDVPVLYSRGPKKNPEGYSSNAIDGFGNGGVFPGWWDVTGVMPAVNGDYDLIMYNTAPTSTSGWTSSVASSGYVSQVDFVGCNNNTTTDGDYVGVLNWADNSNDYTVERNGSVYLGTPPAVQALAGNYLINSGEILDVYEIYGTAGTPLFLNFNVTSGNADLAVMAFGPTSTYFSRSGALWTLNNAGPGLSEAGIFTPSTSGWHGIVVCKNLIGEINEYAYYDMYWGPPAGDYVHTLLPGWTAPVVANNAAGTNGVLPAILNEGPSYGEAGMLVQGSSPLPAGANLAFYLDGIFVYQSGDFPVLNPGNTGNFALRPLGDVKGGRHELGSVLDYLSEVGEELPYGESNNSYFDQYCWMPHALSSNVTQVRTPAPNWANFNNPSWWVQLNYNQDGYRFVTSYWTAVAAMPTNSTEQLDVLGYNHNSSSSTGALLGQVSDHWPAPGDISYVMSNGNVVGNGTILNTGVLNNYAYPYVIPTDSYRIQSAQRITDMYVGFVQNGTLAGSGVTGGTLIHTYDIFLTAGETYSVALTNLSTVNLNAAIFEAGVDYRGLDDALLNLNLAGDAANETGSFTAPVNGYYGVAVSRADYSDLGPAASYGIVVGTRKPATPLIVSIVPVDFSPGYATVHVEITPVTTDVGGNPVVVDFYRLYYDDEGYMTAPAYVDVNSTSLDLYFGNVGMLTQGFLRVTAFDTDGVLLADSQPDQPLPDVSGMQLAPSSFVRELSAPVEAIPTR